MNEVTSKNIDTITGALDEYLQRVIQTTQFNLQDFVNFMEPKFAEAGYRQPPSKLSHRQSNILIIHDCGAGDLIVQSALIREVRRVYPDAYITLIVSPPAYELAQCCPYVDEVILNQRQFAFNWNFPERYRWCAALSRQLLERRFDVCYAVAHNPCTPLIMYMSGARARISHLITDEKEATWYQETDLPTQYMLGLATQRYPLMTYGDHAVDSCLSLLDHTLHAPVSNRSIEVWYTPAEMNAARALLRDSTRPFYAMCMGGSGLNKHYPPEKYAALLKMIIAEEPTATFVILGGGQNDLISAQILKNAAPEIYEKNIIDLTNKASYRQSAAILSLCDMYIGNDTGTTHIAEAVKIPVLMPKCFPADVLENYNDSPRLWYPYQIPNVTIQPEHALPGCTVNEPYTPWGCRSNQPHCITQITPEKIFEGFHILKQRIADNNTEPLCIH